MAKTSPNLGPEQTRFVRRDGAVVSSEWEQPGFPFERYPRVQGVWVSIPRGSNHTPPARSGKQEYDWLDTLRWRKIRRMTIPSISRGWRIVTVTCLLILLASPAFSATKKILLIAGSRSHGTGEHEFRAGCLLLQHCLNQVPGISSEVASNGWPTSDSAFEGVDAILIYADGGNGHPAIKPERLQRLQTLMDKGVGLGCAHYGVEVPKGEPGEALLRWIGGYFEMFWSVNPHWEADFTRLPKHPITRGVKPFKINDEWYYHMRFPEGMKGVTPILTALPPAATLNRPDGPHSGNPAVRASVARGESQPVMWCTVRKDGGRGFGFTGGHFHRNWSDENFRKIVLNGLLWIAKAKVPSEGVTSTLSPELLKANLDVKK